jgi:hypothetical protein
MNLPDSGKQLPPWFTRPCPTTRSSQRGLFEAPLASILPHLQVSLDELIRWRRNDWISFDPCASENVDEFGEPRIWEIEFVRDIVRSGLSDSQIAWLLSQCPKPFTFRPGRIAFSFLHGWVEAVPPDTPEDVIEAQLSSWKDRGDVDSLRNLRDQVDEHLTALGEGDDRISE